MDTRLIPNRVPQKGNSNPFYTGEKNRLEKTRIDLLNRLRVTAGVTATTDVLVFSANSFYKPTQTDIEKEIVLITAVISALPPV